MKESKEDYELKLLKLQWEKETRAKKLFWPSRIFEGIIAGLVIGAAIWFLPQSYYSTLKDNLEFTKQKNEKLIGELNMREAEINNRELELQTREANSEELRKQLDQIASNIGIDAEQLQQLSTTIKDFRFRNEQIKQLASYIIDISEEHQCFYYDRFPRDKITECMQLMERFRERLSRIAYE